MKKEKRQIIDLLDNVYRENAIEVMNDWLKYPKPYHSETCVKVLNEQIIEPLNKWLESEWQKVTYNPNIYTHIEAAQKFKREAEELAYRFKNNLTLLPEMIEVFEDKWREFQLQMGWGASLSVAKHSSSQSKIRQQRKTWNGLIENEMESL